MTELQEIKNILKEQNKIIADTKNVVVRIESAMNLSEYKHAEAKARLDKAEIEREIFQANFDKFKASYDGDKNKFKGVMWAISAIWIGFTTFIAYIFSK